MCRSAAQGGRRCHGSASTSTMAAGGAVPAAASETATPGVPTREQADQLAAELPADSKGWDGQPLDASARRLYALRESGYTGPINQYGYPDTTGEGAGILRRMATDRGENVDW